LGNGIHVQRNQDPATAVVTNITAGPASHPAARVSLAYSYGPAGNVTGAFDVLTGAGYSLNSVGYDSLNRLRHFNITNSTGAHSRSVHYTAGGSIHFRTGVGTYAYNIGMPHAVSKITHGSQVTHYHYNGV